MAFQSMYWLHEVNQKLEQCKRGLKINEVEMPPPPVIIPPPPALFPSTTLGNSPSPVSKPLPGSFPVDTPLEVVQDAEEEEDEEEEVDLDELLIERPTTNRENIYENAPLPETEPLDASEDTVLDIIAEYSEDPVGSDETLTEQLFVEPYKPRRTKYPNYNAFKTPKLTMPDQAPATAPTSAAPETSDYDKFLQHSKEADSSEEFCRLSVETVYTDTSERSDSDKWSFNMERKESLELSEDDESQSQTLSSNTTLNNTVSNPSNDDKMPLGHIYRSPLPQASLQAVQQQLQKSLNEARQLNKETEVARKTDMTPLFGGETRPREEIFEKGVPWGFHGRDYSPPLMKKHFLAKTMRNMEVRKRGVFERGGVLERVKFWSRKMKVGIRSCKTA